MLVEKNSSGGSARSKVMDLIFGRWRSQIVFAAVDLGVFDAVAARPKSNAKTIAASLNADADLLYRLLRAVASLGLLFEEPGRVFTLTAEGDLLTSSHPETLSSIVALEEGPEHYAIWSHLPEMILLGEQNGFVREFGQMAFDYAQDHADYDETFKRAMSGFSGIQTSLALDALQDYDFSSTSTICDIAGGQGHLLSSFLKWQPHVNGILFDQPHVVADEETLWARKMGVAERCEFQGGDMFDAVPAADAYMLKMILHDWNDEECITILENIRRSVTPGGRVFVIEHIVPDGQRPHFSKLYDIHMMCWGTGRERTQAEYAQLYEAAGWRFVGARYPSDPVMGVIEAVAG